MDLRRTGRSARGPGRRTAARGQGPRPTRAVGGIRAPTGGLADGPVDATEPGVGGGLAALRDDPDRRGGDRRSLDRRRAVGDPRAGARRDARSTGSPACDCSERRSAPKPRPCPPGWRYPSRRRRTSLRRRRASTEAVARTPTPQRVPRALTTQPPGAPPPGNGRGGRHGAIELRSSVVVHRLRGGPGNCRARGSCHGAAPAGRSPRRAAAARSGQSALPSREASKRSGRPCALKPCWRWETSRRRCACSTPYRPEPPHSVVACSSRAASSAPIRIAAPKPSRTSNASCPPTLTTTRMPARCAGGPFVG